MMTSVRSQGCRFEEKDDGDVKETSPGGGRPGTRCGGGR